MEKDFQSGKLFSMVEGEKIEIFSGKLKGGGEVGKKGLSVYENVKGVASINWTRRGHCDADLNLSFVG